MSAMISNLMPAPVRRRGSGCGDGRPGRRDCGGRCGGVGGRGGGGVRRIYHLSSMPTLLAFSAQLGGCLRKSERLRFRYQARSAWRPDALPPCAAGAPAWPARRLRTSRLRWCLARAYFLRGASLSIVRASFSVGANRGAI